MASHDLGPFVILRVSLWDGKLWLGYEDSRGKNRYPGEPWYTPFSVATAGTDGWLNTTIWVPTDLSSLLSQMFAETRRGRPGYNGPEPIPVFAAKFSVEQQTAACAYSLWQERGSPTGSPEVDWFRAEAQLGVSKFLSIPAPEVLIERLAAIVAEAPKIEVVRLARENWLRRTPFQLPLKIQPIGPGADHALDIIRNRAWYRDEPDVQEFGLVISPPLGLEHPSGLLLHDVVVCDAADIAPVLKVIASAALGERPRLVVVLDDVPLHSLEPLPDGISLLVVPLPHSGGAGEFVKEMLYGIIHDNPLPAAVKSAMLQRGSLLGGPARLVSDPMAIQDLRLRDALAAVVHDALELHSAPLAGLEMAWYRDVRESEGLDALMWVNETSAAAQAAVENALNLSANFTQESEGLVPIAKARKDLHRARQIQQSIDPHLATIAADSDVMSALGKQEERRVDITLMRAEPGYSWNLFVLPGDRLETRARYQLRVQIGRKSPSSLILEETPAIDPILPDTDPAKGHYLHIVLFPLDFRCLSPTMCRVFLPQYSSSGAVLFEIAAPETPGPARLRVGVYYDLPGEVSLETPPPEYWNHLLQLFLLEGTVGLPGNSRMPGEAPLQVRLEFSRTSRFGNFDELSQRRLSIAINDSPQGTHHLMVKGGKADQDIGLTEATMNEALTRVRQLLEKVTWDDQKAGPRFPENPAQKPEAEFDRWLKDLARAGKELYDNVWRGSGEDFQGVLRQFKASSDGVVQIVRLATNFLFPWSALYDFAVPSDKPGAPPVDVCKGFTRPGYTCEKCLEDCLYPDKSKTFCAYGFWGTRHQVEQLLHTPFQKEDAITVIQPMPEKAVQVSVGVQGQILDQFVSTMEGILGKDSVHSVQSLEEMLDRLWSQKDRPAILLVLGHYETPAPDKPQITFAGNGWLQPADITQKVQDLTKWSAPNPLVVLAACESAAASLASITSFLSAFADARASAVVGTETTVFEGLACRFAKEIAAAMMQDPPAGGKRQTLGNAVLQFRRQLLLDFNPLGLVFTPYGDAGLHRI
jgi:hypothetical protein